MNGNDKKPSQNKVDWSHEAAKSGKIAGKVVWKILSYILNIFLTILLIGLIAGIIVATTFAIYVKNYIDPVVDLSDFAAGTSSQTTKLYYMDYSDRENRIGELIEIEDQRLYGSENSIWVPYTEIPQNLVDAFVSIEDKRFWTHNGVDWRRTVGAILHYVLPVGGSYGGSTITQQTIKNLTGEDDFTPQRKVQEILRALNLEKQMDKTQILELYLNNIYLSQHCYGVQAAAYTYFGKDVKDLTLIECAAIAGITNSPTRYDPVQNPDKQAMRRDAILEEMLDQGYITKEEFDGAYGKELVLNYQGMATDVTVSTNSWYTDQVLTEIVDRLVEEKGYTRRMAFSYIYTGGLQIITLQDPEIQQTLEEVYANDDNFIKTNNAIQPQSAMVIIDPYTGDVLGLVGARGEKTGNLVQNHATMSHRSPGSSIKPLSVYGPALEYGVINYATVLDDTPAWFYYAESDKDHENPIAYPKNLPTEYRGLTTINSAITRSVNTIAIKTLQRLTLERSFNFVKNDLNMKSFIESEVLADGTVISDIDYAPLALGSMCEGVTVLEMTAGYQIFVNNGVYNKPRTWLEVRDSDGNVILSNDPVSYVVMSEQNASIMNKLLENVVTKGTARSVTLQYSVDCAGKTGTASNDFDRWYLGYTPYYVGGVWYGYEMPQELGTAANPSVIVWNTVMTKLHQKFIDSGEPLKKFETAEGIVEATYCKYSGKLMTDACYLDPRGDAAEVGYFTATTVPTEYCDCHVLVDYDTKTGGIASAGCPRGNIKKVALTRIDKDSRVFPVDVAIVDSQYIYIEIPENLLASGEFEFPTTHKVAYYADLYKKDTYGGYTYLEGGNPFNSYCCEHHIKDTPETGEESLPPETENAA